MKDIERARSAWSIFSPSPAIQRLVIPGELLRIIIRDVSILSIFFTILQSEFDLMVKEYDAVQKKELLSVLSADSSLSQPVKDAFQKFLKEDSWLQSDEYIRFKCNLPFNNLDVVQTADEGIIGGVGFEASGELPGASDASNPLDAAYANNTSTTSNPLEESLNESGEEEASDVVPSPIETDIPRSAQGVLKGGRRAQSKHTSVFALRGVSM
jgi:hypothetical protein